MTDEDLRQRHAATLEDRVEVATVNHRLRVAMLFGALSGALLFVVFWITGTPKRWIAALVGVACAAGLYLALR
jgi:hypothetical protein